MTAIAARVFETAMALGDEERIVLAERLLGSVHNDPEIFAEQLQIAKRRVAEIESGMVKAIPGALIPQYQSNLKHHESPTSVRTGL